MSQPKTASNTLLLRRQLTELSKHPVEGFSAGKIPIMPLIGNHDTKSSETRARRREQSI